MIDQSNKMTSVGALGWHYHGTICVNCAKLCIVNFTRRPWFKITWRILLGEMDEMDNSRSPLTQPAGSH